MSWSRRAFLNTTPAVLAPMFLSGVRVPAAAPPSSFPSHPLDLARDMVGASHGNIARVKELLALRPTLARAAYEWGFGDWEDALGAASHVGNREIADLLLANGARPTIFSAAMLGQLDVVKAFIAALPGIESTPGPHSITLWRHAMAGGASAQPVADYLKTLPGADARPASEPLSPESLAELTGEYMFGPALDERVTIAVTNNVLTFTRTGRPARGLTHVGNRSFFPIGAPKVRITFRAEPAGMTFSVVDGDLVVDARRTGGR